jgi:uncharacterized membrane protein
MEGRAGRTRNIFLVWFVWPLITLGIYFFVWYYKVNREARDFARIEVSPAVSVIAVLFGWIIIVPPFVSIYRTGERVAQMQRAAGLEATCIPIVGLLLTFVFHLDSLYYQYELNRILSSACRTRRLTSSAVGRTTRIRIAADPGLPGRGQPRRRRHVAGNVSA